MKNSYVVLANQPTSLIANLFDASVGRFFTLALKTGGGLSAQISRDFCAYKVN